METSQTVTFNQTQPEYVIKLKNRRFPWWILSFLLLLLLFVKCNRTIDFKVVAESTNLPVENAKVTIRYAEKESAQKIEISNNSSKEGLVSFVIDKKPIYKIIFGIDGDVLVNAEASHPEYSDELLMDKMSALTRGTQTIKLKKGSQNIKIQTIDSITRKPIEGAEIEIVVDSISTKATSDASGFATVEKVKTTIGKELIINARKQNYETTRKVIKITENQFSKETVVAMLSIENGGMRGERGELNVNLKWATKDDLDLIILDPCNDTIYYQRPFAFCKDLKGILDVDANVKTDSLLNDPQENTFWLKAPKGDYQVIVLLYKKRTKGRIPFTITLLNKNDKKIFTNELQREKEFKLITKTKFE